MRFAGFMRLTGQTNADEWKTVDALRKMEVEERLEKQLVVRDVKAHVTEGNIRQRKNREV